MFLLFASLLALLLGLLVILLGVLLGVLLDDLLGNDAAALADQLAILVLNALFGSDTLKLADEKVMGGAVALGEGAAELFKALGEGLGNLDVLLGTAFFDDGGALAVLFADLFLKRKALGEALLAEAAGLADAAAVVVLGGALNVKGKGAGLGFVLDGDLATMVTVLAGNHAESLAVATAAVSRQFEAATLLVGLKTHALGDFKCALLMALLVVALGTRAGAGA